jgi:cyclopropane fatty-acyl-phospholipid synthase-like methyltransferase
MSDAYGFLAPFYQPIAKLVFGRDLIYANQAFLEGVEGKKLLIIGGGDGEAYRDFEGNVEGEYWDLSYKMTQLAGENLKTSGLKIQTGAWPGKGKFDRIVLPFVLDTMSDPEIVSLLSLIKSALSDEGQVIVSDFFNPVSLGQKVIQKSMIGFFRLITSHRRKDLPCINSLFKNAGFELNHEKCWRKGWIRAQVWQAV